jgi:hypothetical protein
MHLNGDGQTVNLIIGHFTVNYRCSWVEIYLIGLDKIGYAGILLQ